MHSPVKMIPYPFREPTPPPPPPAAPGRKSRNSPAMPTTPLHPTPPQTGPQNENYTSIPSNAISFRHPEAFSRIRRANTTGLLHPFTNHFPGINIHAQRVSGEVAVWTTFTDMESAYKPETKGILRGLMAGLRSYRERFDCAEEMPCFGEFCDENYELFGPRDGAERVCFACGVDHEKEVEDTSEPAISEISTHKSASSSPKRGLDQAEDSFIISHEHVTKESRVSPILKLNRSLPKHRPRVSAKTRTIISLSLGTGSHPVSEMKIKKNTRVKAQSSVPPRKLTSKK